MIQTLCYVVIYLVEAIASVLYFEKLFARKRDWLWLGAISIAVYGLLFALFSVSSVALNCVFFILGNNLILWICYESSMKERLLHCFFLCGAMVGTELVATYLLSFSTHDFDAYLRDASVLSSMALISKLLYFGVCMVAVLVLPKKARPIDSGKQLGLYCIMPICTAVISVAIVYVGLRSGMSRTDGTLMIMYLISLFGANLLFFVLYNIMQKLHNEKTRLQLQTQKEQADLACYRALQQQSENWQIVLHDIRNHLTALRQLADERNNTQILDYISRLDEEIHASERQRFCNNSILNYLLQQLHADCLEIGVTFSCSVQADCQSIMPDVDITSLFGNLFSNALQSATQSEQKIIALSIKQLPEQQSLLISLKNSCDQPPTRDADGNMQSTKKNPKKHGIGQKSIQRTVKRNHGVLVYSYDESAKMFHTIMQFPLRLDAAMD